MVPESRAIDIEITNRCNALCTFCPRDKMPPLGKMKQETYTRILERIDEYGRVCTIHFAGFGEPIMHPLLADFVSQATSRGIRTGINTNAALLDEVMANRLLDAGLSQISFNVAALDEDYEEIYNLDFDNTLKNIKYFLHANAGRCQVWMGIVENDLNHGRIKELKQYWKKLGVRHFFVATESNRGGALLSASYYHQDDGRYYDKATNLLRERAIDVECSMPKASVFISQEGDYYLCCQDWRKQMCLGSVHDLSFDAVDALKQVKIRCGNAVCAQCDFDPVNIVRDALMRQDNGDMTVEEVESKIAYVRETYVKREGNFPRV